MQSNEQSRRLRCDLDQEDFCKDIDAQHFYRQIFAYVGPLLTLIGNGTVIGSSAILLHELKRADSEIEVNIIELSWIASIAPLAMILGSFLSGGLMEHFGRRFTILAACSVSFCGWLVTYFGTSPVWFLAGRLLNGLGGGLSGPAAVCYMGEVSHPKYKELFLTGTYAAIASGALITNLIGAFASWRPAILVVLMVPVITWFMVFFLPESYVFYINRGECSKARESYSWFKGDEEEDQGELEELLADRKGQRTKGHFMSQVWGSGRKPQFLRPLFIASLVFFTSNVSGYQAVVFHCLAIVKGSAEGINEYAPMLTFDAFRVIMAIIGCVLVRKFRIRPLLMISGIGTSASLYVLAIMAHVSSSHPDSLVLSGLPVIPSVTFLVFLDAGLLSLAQTVCGEIFAPATRGLGVGMSNCFGFLAFFVVVQTNPDLTAALSAAGSFIVYATLVFCGTFLLYFILPETKGKTLVEVERFFTDKGCRTEMGKHAHMLAKA